MEAYRTISFALLATWAACALVERNDRAGLVRSTVAMDIVPKKAAAFDEDGGGSVSVELGSDGSGCRDVFDEMKGIT